MAQLSKYAHLNEEILELSKSGNSHYQIARVLIKKYSLDCPVSGFRHYIWGYINHSFDREIIAENVRLAKQKQLAVDKNRISNKSFREDARIENGVVEFAKEISAQNKQFAKELSKLKFKNQSYVKGGTGVIQITDVHANELIDLPHNRYDFNIMSKRLKSHITESLAYFQFRGVSKVLMLFTGDLLNSDRRLDELIAASTNRAKATVLTIHILKQAICHVREHYPVDIISVLGNESRANKEMTFSNEALSDNYDFTIIAQLKQIFEFE